MTKRAIRLTVIGGIAAVVALATVVTWLAIRSPDDGNDGSLPTAAASDRVGALVTDAAGDPGVGVGVGSLAACPAGDAQALIGEIADGLGGDPFTRIAEAEPEVLVFIATENSPQTNISCVSAIDEGETNAELGVIVSHEPATMLADYDIDEGRNRGTDLRDGRVHRFCRLAEESNPPFCVAMWTDDELFVAVGGAGSMFTDVEPEELERILIELLPGIVDSVAQAQ